jgi:L-iditol 2-dehydrogenase
MRAVRVLGPERAGVVELDAPVPGDGEVVVAVAAAAVCGTDRKLVRSGGPQGITLGHEAAGRLPDGTLVGVHPDTGCGRCNECARGQTNRCADRVAVGIQRDGALAGYVAVPAPHAVPLDRVPVHVAPLLEPLACCVHAVRRVGAFSGPALVVGAGTMGVLLLWVLQAAGHRVAVSQRSAARRDQAARLGADVVLAPDGDVAKALGEAPGVVFVTALGAEPLARALEQAAPGGTVHAFAGTPGGAPVDANLVHYRHLALVGSTGSGLVDYVAARDLVVRGDVDLGRLPHGRTDLDGAVESLSGSGTGRSVDAGATTLRLLVDVTGADR